MVTLGLTGGIGSGKSAVAKVLCASGAALIDADQISKQMTLAGGAAMPALAQAFGDGIVATDGALSRDAMRAMMLADPSVKARLEAIIHPLIAQHMLAQRQKALETGHALVVMDIPLLVEGGRRWRQIVDRVWVVDCGAESQIQRVLARNGWSRAQVEAMIATQASRAKRLHCADIVTYNDDITLEQLAQTVQDQLRRLLGGTGTDLRL